MIKQTHTMCVRCVMDTSDPDIKFDEMGMCSHCQKYDELSPLFRFTESESEQKLKVLTAELKRKGRYKEYDCILGLSGGVDSSYLAYLAKKLSMRVLVIHFDNGWNSEISVANIKKIVEKCGFDLHTYVINWPEFRDLQRSFLKASVIDIEMLTDHAILASVLKVAKDYKVKSILSGGNYATEHGMPPSWVWRKTDLTNIKSIQRRFGTLNIKSFPTISSFKWYLIENLGLGFDFIRLLNNINYKKIQAMKTLNEEFGWQYYGGKHYESVFTKFYQAYILPNKFGIDKRKTHLSALIRNDEIKRDEAIDELNRPLYTNDALKADKEYVLKKLGFTDKEFDEIMAMEPKPHTYYPSDEKIHHAIRVILKCLRPIAKRS